MQTETAMKIERNKYTFEKEYPVKYYEMDFNKVLKPSALMNFLQDIATINAEMLGFGYSFTYPKNYGWFLIKYHMEFDAYPADVDEVIIKTEARGISKIIANRDFEICTKNGKRLARVASNWVMIDLQNKNIIPLSKIVDFMPAFEKRENDLCFGKIQPIENQTFEKVFEIRYDDIDINQHVNNANYIVWAFEVLPYEFKEEHRIKTLDIVYKKEITFGHNVISRVEINQQEKTTNHVLINETNGEELCFVNVEWE